MSVALPGLIPLITQTPGCASLARSYSLSALPGRGWVSTSQTHVYKVPKFLTNAGTAEHFRVSPPEAVVCLNEINALQLDSQLKAFVIGDWLLVNGLFDSMKLAGFNGKEQITNRQ
jgi:hypothetical protein